MEAIFEIFKNIFSGIDLDAITSTISGFLAEYDFSAAVDTIVSFFGGLFG